MSGLFRPESLHSQRQTWLGSIHVMQPLGLVWLTFGVLATLVAVSTFLFWGELPRTTRLSGVLVPDRGWIRLQPPMAGRLVSMTAREGQVVRAGEALFTLAVEQPQWNEDAAAGLRQSLESRRRSFEDAVRQAERRLKEEQRGLADRLAGRQREAEQLNSQALLLEQRLALAQQALARLESLKSEAFVSAAQVQAKNEDVLGLRAEAAAVARQRQALSGEIAALEAEGRELPLKTAERIGDIERDRAEAAEIAAREDAQAAQRLLVVRAPADGVLTALHVNVGQPVAADAALATLTPAGAQLQARLLAPSSALGFLQNGQAVHLRVQAYPYQKFGLQPGTVLEVAQAPMQAAELAPWPIAHGMAGNEPMYRVTVALQHQGVAATGQWRPLLPGMQLEADVVLERRRLVEWLFEPLLGWARR